MGFNKLYEGDTIYVGIPFELNGENIKCGSYRITNVTPDLYKFWGKHFLKTGTEIFGKHFTTYPIELAMQDLQGK